MKEDVEAVRDIEIRLKEAKEILELASDDELAQDIFSEVKEVICSVEQGIEILELKKMLGGKHDRNNAILSINAGAGGTESCDWAQMLFRMYTQWINNKGYAYDVIDSLPGDEAGIKNLTMIVKGTHTYGYLKAEKGVHRLVRISPFDANKRRHTSFASVDVIPEIIEEDDIEIEEKDLKVDTYRSRGAGGQHVNTTDSAVRISHLPTGIIVQCQNERSQIKNRATAMKILKAKLYELKESEEQKEKEKEYGTKKDIAWGSQIRSYVLHPYSMIKDHRTNVETSNVQAVLDGEIDIFTEAFLKEF